MSARQSTQSAQDVATTNRLFYDALWSETYLARPESFNTWGGISSLLPNAPMRLELGAGLKPRLPVAGTHFVDLSAPAIRGLNAGGGIAVRADVGALPFADRQFDLVCALDVIEHVEDDRGVFAEVVRVLKDDGVLIFSVPVHPHLWSEVDEFVGHVRRYDPVELSALLSSRDLHIEKSAVFGMQPTNPRLVNLGMWWLKHHRRLAMLSYNRLILPWGIFFQKPLRWVEDLIDTTGVDEIVVVCRRRALARR